LGIMMFFSALAQPIIAEGQNSNGEQFSDKDVPYSSANIFSKLTDELGLNPDLDWGESFGYDESDADKVGQNMYVVIYKKVLEDPAQKTMKEISGKYGLNEGDMWLVLNGNYTPIIDRKPGLSQEELLEKVLEMQDEYAEMRDLNDLEADIKAGVEPAEFFANGDVGDSGFDVLHDLQLIEEILFLKTSPIDIGKSYKSATDGGPVGTGQAPVTSSEVTAPAGIKTPSPESISGGGGTDTISESGSGTGPLETRSGEVLFNPNACFIESEYGDALDEFEENAINDSTFKDGSAGQEVRSGQVPAGGAPGAGNIADETEEFLAATPHVITPVQPAEADSWLKDKYCTEYFCLEINFVKEPAKSAFANADNCIACHVEKTNDVLKEVINHSLVPTKATGNLGESAECHNAMLTAFGSLSMNVYSVGMPIQTPINDDLMYGTDIGDEWDNYCESVAFFFGLCGGDEDEDKKEEEAEEVYEAPPSLVDRSTKQAIVQSAEEVYEAPPSLVDRSTKQAIVQSAEEVTQSELITRINEQIVGAQEQQEEEVKKKETTKSISENAVLYDPLKFEVDRMLEYFNNIKDILHSLHEKVDTIPGDQACYKLKNKNECE